MRMWPHLVVFWVAFVWAFWPEFGIVNRARKSQRTKQAAADPSLQALMRIQAGSFLVAFAAAAVPALRFAPAYRLLALDAGTATIVVGSLLRRHCHRMLGKSFTGDVQARSDQQVVTRGAYRYVRHPSYTAGIILNTGVGLALGSPVSAAVLAVGSFVAYVIRMRAEERTLLATIGEPYREFLRTRKRLVPFVY